MSDAIRLSRKLHGRARACCSVPLLVSGLALSSAAQAVLINFGTAQAITARTCTAGVSGCDDTSLVHIVYGGAPGSPSSSASASWPGFGSASGTASLSSGIGSPVLSGTATSEPGARTNTNSIALQRFVYTGLAPTTRTFGGSFSYAQSVTGNFPFDINSLSANIILFTLPTDMIEVGNSAESNFLALFDLASLPGFTVVGEAQFTNNATGAGVESLGVTVNLNPGDAIWAWAILQTPATGGGSTNVSGFTLNWDDISNLVPAVVAPVPEPGSLALLGLGLGLLLSRRAAVTRESRAPTA